MTDQPSRLEVLSLTSEIVSSYVANNSLPVADLTGVIQQVFQTLHTLSADTTLGTFGVRPKPAVAINKSITDEYIVCLEDGKRLQMLKRHLKTVYNMSVEQYKERWGLPSDYPVVSPSYARRRSEIAKTSGLGMSRHRRKMKVIDATAEVAMPRAVNS
jgi:predicted transcriptional regulator